MSVNTTPLNLDPALLERLEEDLIEKCITALNKADVASMVYGVFSLDDLEGQHANSNTDLLGVGCGYNGCRPTGSRTNPDVESKMATMMEYRFMVLFAAPVDDQLSQRHNTTKILSVLRRGVMGTRVADSTRTQRYWEFVEEGPVISESSRTMLYYTQVWRFRLPEVGN